MPNLGYFMQGFSQGIKDNADIQSQKIQDQINQLGALTAERNSQVAAQKAEQDKLNAEGEMVYKDIEKFKQATSGMTPEQAMGVANEFVKAGRYSNNESTSKSFLSLATASITNKEKFDKLFNLFNTSLKSGDKAGMLMALQGMSVIDPNNPIVQHAIKQVYPEKTDYQKQIEARENTAPGSEERALWDAKFRRDNYISPTQQTDNRSEYQKIIEEQNKYPKGSPEWNQYEDRRKELTKDVQQVSSGRPPLGTTPRNELNKNIVFYQDLGEALGEAKKMFTPDVIKLFTVFGKAKVSLNDALVKLTGEGKSKDVKKLQEALAVLAGPRSRYFKEMIGSARTFQELRDEAQKIPTFTNPEDAFKWLSGDDGIQFLSKLGVWEREARIIASRDTQRLILDTAYLNKEEMEQAEFNSLSQEEQETFLEFQKRNPDAKFSEIMKLLNDTSSD